MRIAIGYAWSNFTTGYHIERALAALGHDVIYVGLPSTTRPGYGGTDSIQAILAGLAVWPECFMWIDSSGRYLPQDIELLDIPTACYLIDVHLGQWRKQVARFFDLVFVAQKDYVSEYAAAVNHANVHWLPLAAASDVHIRHDLPRCYDVGFVGATGHSHKNSRRLEQLSLIAREFKTNDFYKFYDPDAMSRIYSQSKIVFNSSIAGDVTMRVFEGTACGALMLTDSVRNGLDELFTIGSEVVTYADTADMLEKVRTYLRHDAERERIANAGYVRTHTQHTYAHRAQTLIDAISQHGGHRSASMRAAPADARREARLEIFTKLGMLDAIFDQERAARAGPVTRLWRAAPALLRRIIR